MTDSTADIVAELWACEDRRYQAMIDKDLAALDELFDDQLVYTHSNGLVDSKASYLDAIEKRRFDYRAAKHSDETTALHGDAALLAGRAQLEVHAGGRELQLDARFTVLYVRKDGRWRFAAWQSTPLPK